MDNLCAGDLVWVDFEPAFGHEHGGRRPALVMSVSPYNTRSSFVLVCPITRSRKTWPFHIDLPDNCGIDGAIILDRLKSVDKRRIVSRVAGKRPQSDVEILHERLASIVCLDPAQ